MDLDEVLQWDAHFLLHGAGVVHMAADVEELGAAVPGATKAGKPVGSSPRENINNDNVTKSHKWSHNVHETIRYLQIVGATATVSTLVTVVGQPKTPTSAGKGGFRRGLPGG